MYILYIIYIYIYHIMKYLLPPSMKGIILKSKDKETYLGLYQT